jgi:hypothetical protein
MEPAKSIEQYLTQAQQLLEEGKELDSVRHHLAASGADELTVDTIIRQIKSLSYLKRRRRGFLLGLFGSILLVAGFILTVIFYHSGISIHYVMYGMTSIGVILLIAGLVDVIGW